MKVCPVCNSRCFDDMETCYGCMHTFKENETKVEEIPISTSSTTGVVSNSTECAGSSVPVSQTPVAVDAPVPNFPASSTDPIPEYYETLEFPIIELVEDFYNRRNAASLSEANTQSALSSDITQLKSPAKEVETSGGITSSEDSVVIKITIPKNSVLQELTN